MQEYKTIDGDFTAEYTEKHSRFIATVFHCESEAEASKIIEGQKSKYWDARHNVYAYVLQNGTARFSDDGEPHGTAGMPVLDVIKNSSVTDVLIVVTRYFGGILLGTGGLVHAYSKGASLALSAAETVTMEIADSLKISCEYNMYGIVSSTLSQYGAVIRNTEYTDSVCVYADIKSETTDFIIEKLIDSCNGKVCTEILAHGYMEF